MDDNILMEYCQPIPSFGHPSCSPSTANGELIALDAEQNISKLQATHIIDFSDLSIGR